MVSATRNLSIRLSVRDTQTVRRALESLGKDGQSSLRRIEKASRPASKGLVAVNAAAQEGQTFLRGYAAQAGPLGSALSAIGPGGLLAAAAIGAIAAGAAYGAREVEELAARAEAMRDAFGRMAARQGMSPVHIMEEIGAATRGTLSEIQALTVANTALSSGIEPLFLNLGAIIRDVRSVSTALGRNASEDIERVISAINKQEQELLDELGIVARAATAYKQYAAQIGTTASKLDDLQKRTAFANLVIGELRSKAEAVGDPINKSAEASERFNAAWTNLKITLGSFVETGGMLDKLATGIEAVSEAVKNTQFSGQAPPRLLPALPPGTPDPADVGLFPKVTTPAPVSGDTLTVTERLVQLDGNLRSLNTAVIDALSVTRQRIQIEEARPEVPGGPETLTLDDVIDLDFQVDTLEIENSLDDWSNQTLRNYEAETVLAKKRRDLRLQGIADEDELARANLRWRQIREETELVVANASEEHFLTLRQLHAEETRLFGEKLAAAERAEQAENALAEKRELVARVSSETAGILSRLAPQMRGFFDAAASFATGDILGGISGAIHGLLDLFGVARDSTDRLTDSVERYAAKVEESSRASQSVIERLFGQAEGYQELKQQALEPINTLFRNLKGQYPNRADFENIRALFTVMAESGAQFGDASQVFGDGITRGLEKAVEESGMSLHEWQQTLEDVFGPTGTLTDAAQALFDTSSAAKQVSGSLDPLERQLRAQFDFSEIALRRQAQGEFETAGADPFAKAQVFERLSDSLGALTTAESKLKRRLQRSGVSTSIELGTVQKPLGESGAEVQSSTRAHVTPATATQEGVTPAGVTSAGVTLEPYEVSTFADLIRLPSSDDRIHLAWEDAVFIDEKYGAGGRRPETWGDIARLPDRSARMTVSWEDAVFFSDKYGVNGRRPRGWSDVVSVAQLEAMPRVARQWSEAVDLKRSTLTAWGVRGWSDIVRLERAEAGAGGSRAGLSRHERSWAAAIHLKTANLTDFGARQWSDIVRLERAEVSGGGYGFRPGLSRHERSWSAAIHLKTANLTDFGARQWSDIVRLERAEVSGGGYGFRPGLSRHERSWSAAINLKTANLTDFGARRWSDIVRLERAEVSAGSFGFRPGLSRHQRSWSAAINLKTANLTDFGARQWSDIVRLERAEVRAGGFGSRPGLSRHERTWAAAINMQTANLTHFGARQWSDIVRLERGSGELSKHARSFGDVIDIRPTTLNVTDLIELNPMSVRASSLIQVTGKLKLSDVFDTSELARFVDARIQRSRRDRRSREDPLMAHAYGS